MENYLLEAFQKLSLLEDDFNFSADRDVVDELKSFVADDVEEIPEEPVIDVTAESEQDLADNYVGKVILECECCHTRIYKEEAEVVVDDEQGLANVDEECPVCGNTMGYTVIGKIEKFDDGNIEDEEEEEIEVENDPAEEEPPVESLRARVKKRKVTESKEDVCPECGKNPCVCEKCEGESCDEGKSCDEGIEELRRRYGKKAKTESCDEDITEATGMEALRRKYGKANEELEEELDLDVEFKSEDAKKLEDPEQDPVLEESLDEGIKFVVKGSYQDPNQRWSASGKPFKKTIVAKDENSVKDIIKRRLGTDRVTFDSIEKLDESLNESALKNLSGAIKLAKLVKWVSDNADEAEQCCTKEEEEKIRKLIGSVQSASKTLELFEDEEVKKAVAEAALEMAVENYSKVKSIMQAAIKRGPLKESKEVCEGISKKLKNISKKFIDMLGEGLDESLNEGVDNLELDADGTHVSVESNEDGTTEIKLGPTEPDIDDMSDFAGEEEIVPLSDEEQDDILANEPEGEEDEFDFDDFDEFEDEEPVEGEEEEEEEEEEEVGVEEESWDINNFNEHNFNDLCESYLRKVYENVNTFETKRIRDLNDKLVVEGVIKFKNKKQMKSNFVFTEAKETKSGKVVLEGYNATFSKQPKSFVVKGTLKKNNYVAESMTYRYTARNLSEGKVEKTKVQGKVKVVK